MGPTIRESVPEIDGKSLRTVLKAIARQPDHAREFRLRGNPATPFRLRGGLVWLRVQEMRSCIKRTDSANVWAPSDEYEEAVVNRAAFRYLAEKWAIDDIARELQESLTTKLSRFAVAFEISGLERFTGPISLEDGRLGPLDEVIAAEGLRLDEEKEYGPQPLSPPVVLVRIEAPDADRAMRLAALESDKILDILATCALRSRFNTGPAWEIELGRRVWIWPDGEPSSPGPGYYNPWLRGTKFGLVGETLGPTNHLKTTVQPWRDLPDGDLRVALQLAYITMGAAMRNATLARAGISLGWTAIESAFAPETENMGKGERSARTIALRLQLAVAKEGGTEHPAELANFYMRRNMIVHDAHPAWWKPDEARTRLGRLYRHLDELAEFSLDNQCSTYTQLASILANPAIREKTAGWAKQWHDEAVENRDAAVLDSSRRQGKRTVQLWNSVLELLGDPVPVKPLWERILAWLRAISP